MGESTNQSGEKAAELSVIRSPVVRSPVVRSYDSRLHPFSQYLSCVALGVDGFAVLVDRTVFLQYDFLLAEWAENFRRGVFHKDSHV